MLPSTIEACPDALWDREDDHNAFWVLAYHTLYFAPFEREVSGRPGYGKTDLGDWTELQLGDTYSKADVLAYCDLVDGLVVDLAGSAPFDAASGFHWLPFSRGEAHLYNLRHIQHHAGQLAER